jgi:hypothetical protein
LRTLAQRTNGFGGGGISSAAAEGTTHGRGGAQQ